ncbi:pyrroloquinoline quinone biosynthesis protein PqqE [Pseudomonas sp. Irchel 3E20]|uniref:pyrroloquinoline quinone biosynthesis protein PqqE n=1 Tax=Pseudomonas sp. Irchel 3E20 TaxID=2008983 RepID=UPI000BA42333|nr:pyrroloquinoline quinone biosynthesis protein PqqE [Pseudomonas sp. Irchel 3E20]
MNISGNTAFYSGVSAIQTGLNRVDQAAGQIAGQSVDRTPAGFQVDRAQQSDMASDLVDMAQGKIQAELGVKVAKASDEVLGTLIDTYA